MTWSAKQYVAFEHERTRPVRDLLAAVPVKQARFAVDIGCGPGNSTEVLAARFPDATVAGFDSSADMIEAARKRMPNVRFDIADLGSWMSRGAAGPFDVILANAVLHWVPNHAALYPELVARLTSGGALAVQMPDNLDEPAQRLMREIAADGPWKRRLADADASRVSLAGADWYYNLLHPSCARTEIWRTTYYHALPGPGSIVEWFKGTGLRPFLDPLDEAEREEFLARYAAAIARAHPPVASGSVLLPFPRLFIVAVR
jgi:trans-aconitate 2-methyltransferase